MANTETKSKAGEAARKRSIARRFNDALAIRTPQAKPLDQRTARRLERYRKELRESSKSQKKSLSALELAKRVDALLRHGDRIKDIKKLTKPREYEYDEKNMVALLQEMHATYDFLPEAYRFAGVQNETLVAAGVLDEMPKRRGPRKKDS